MEQPKLLSLCIPTYNRAVYLEKCLESIVRQVGNNAEVEVIVSDNVSEDNTKEVAERYATLYNNVKYFRNETNIGGDRNFLQVLKLGEGKYLKLMNDYLEFRENGALKMLEIVRNHIHTSEVLFFANGLSHLKRKEFHYSNNLDEFLTTVSYWCTWIGSFGIWKKDLTSILPDYNFKTSSFTQTELLFESVILKGKAVTYGKPIFISHEVINKKTGYNFFDLFINVYLNKLIVDLKNEKKIKYWTYIKEKNRLFSNFVFMWYKKIRIKKNLSVDLNSEGMESIIFKTYKYNPILYLYILYLPFYLIGFYFKKIPDYFKRNK